MSIEDHIDHVRRPGRPATTVRIALWCARHRWLVLALWLLVMAGLLMTSSALGGDKLESAMGTGDSRTEAQKGMDSFATAGKDDPGESLWLVISAGQRMLTDPALRAELASIMAGLRGATVQAVGTTGPAPIFESLTSPLEAPPMAGLISSDGHAALVVARMSGDTPTIEAKVSALQGLMSELGATYPDLQLMPLNGTMVNREVGTLVGNDLEGSMSLTLPITFLILLLAFGTVVAGLVPIVLALTALIGAFGLMGIYSQLVEPISQYASQVVVLIGLAVAIDYSLFIISRFRTERRAGRSVEAAIEVASSTAGRAVFFSGLAVAISLAGLLLMDNSIFRSIAIATISVVLISVVGSLTFLPAVLAVLGRRIEWLAIPYFSGDRAEGTSIWARLVRAATGHPVVVVAATGIFLLGAAAPVTQLRLGSTGIDGLPPTLPSVQAWRYMSEEWPQGTSLTLDTFVTGADRPDTKAAIAAYIKALPALHGMGRYTGTDTSGDGTVAAIHFTLPGGTNDAANWDLVRTVRSQAVPAAFAAAPDATVYVSGDAAAAMDQTEMFARQTPMVMAFVLGLSFLLLLVVFHSIVIPVVAILLTLLSAGAAFGALQLVFQGSSAEALLDVTPSPLESWLPAMIFTILFGLSMDYQVFILTRVKEAKDRGLDSVDAVVKGISVTAGTVTSAAAIMVAVFAIFVSLHFVMIRQMGLGLAVAVLVDATVVRSLLMPAIMKLLGDRNWYLPRFLDWIPRVTIEGEPEQALPAGDGGLVTSRPTSGAVRL